uniref:Uncharacterized protein n=1 Tax=Anguilla anguilla TaxID=7936 RepID=A0A0E9PGS7_ANGAN
MGTRNSFHLVGKPQCKFKS